MLIAITPAEGFETIAPFLGVAIPFLMARTIHPEAGAMIQRWLPIGLAVALTGVSLLTEPMDAITAETVIIRLAVIFAGMQATYILVDSATRRWLGGSMNRTLPGAAPEGGLFKPAAVR